VEDETGEQEYEENQNEKQVEENQGLISTQR
jgi:hypothetical protein